MRPDWLKTKIFLDSGDPDETKKVLDLLGFLDGQTTNPTLVARNPEIKARLEKGDKFLRRELLDFYRITVQKISSLIPYGSVSIETYADKNTLPGSIYEQAREMNTWIPNAHIKMPVIDAGLSAAERAIGMGINVNLTLCFNQSQAAAVCAATKVAHKGGVFISPFVGRLDDIGLMGVDLVENVLRMYKNSDNHVEVLAASVRNIYHLLHVLRLNVDIVTCPFKVLEEWAKDGCSRPGDDFHYNQPEVKSIGFEYDIKLNHHWKHYNIYHPLTDKGIELFCNDWNSLLKE